MPNFSFKGRNRQGETISGERSADSRQALSLALRRDQIFLLEAQEKKAAAKRFDFGGNPTPKDVAVFTRQFSVMIDAGVPLVQCIELLAQTQDNPKFKAALKAVQTDVESGNSLAASMKNHPKVFDDLYTNMVAAVEAGGPIRTGVPDRGRGDCERRHHTHSVESRAHVYRTFQQHGCGLAVADAHRHWIQQFRP